MKHFEIDVMLFKLITYYKKKKLKDSCISPDEVG